MSVSKKNAHTSKGIADEEAFQLNSADGRQMGRLLMSNAVKEST